MKWGQALKLHSFLTRKIWNKKHPLIPPPWRCSPTRAMASLFFMRLLDHTQPRTTVGWAPLDERSARRRDLYLTAHNTHSRQTSMPPVGFETTIPASEQPQTYALDRAATGNGNKNHYAIQIAIWIQGFQTATCDVYLPSHISVQAARRCS